jgi:hypothetical protein
MMSEMPEVAYSSREIIKLILKENKIHEGHWMFLVHFGFSAMNVGESDSGEDATPAAVASVKKIGIKQIPQPLPFSVDASKENPSPKKSVKKNNLAIPEYQQMQNQTRYGGFLIQFRR